RRFDCTSLRFFLLILIAFALLAYLLLFSSSFHFFVHLRNLLSFPTRRSSDLKMLSQHFFKLCDRRQVHKRIPLRQKVIILKKLSDRKSTRLNSSHVSISYAVFCLKKKTEN